MMLLVANIANREKGNQVEYLNLLKKTQILKRVEEYLKDGGTGHNVALAIACELTLPFEEDDLPARDHVTLGEWLDEKGVELTKADKQRLANLVADLYLSEYGKKPKVVARKNEDGYFRNKANGFRPDQLHLLDLALEQLDHKDVIRKTKTR